MVSQVKQFYVDIFLKADHLEATIDDVIITEFVGYRCGNGQGGLDSSIYVTYANIKNNGGNSL